MGDVTWFDSLGIGILLGHYISVTQRGGRVLLLNTGPRISALLKMVRLEDRFGWPSDLDDAAQMFEGSS